MRRKVFAFVLCLGLTLCAGAQPSGDALARMGAYRMADAAYQQEEKAATSARARARLLYARMALAQARNDPSQMYRLSPQLEPLLSEVGDPALSMRFYLVRGAGAYRIRDLEQARKAMEKARPLATQLARQGDPGGALGLFECESYDYLRGLGKKGRPRSEDYYQACGQASQVCLQNPATPQRPLWPMDLMRSLFWTRMWVWQAWEYSYLAYRKHDQLLAGQWGQVSGLIAGGAAQLFFQGYQATKDQELLNSAIHALLELTEGFAEAPDTPKMLAQIGPVFEQPLDTEEMSFMRGRYHRSQARYQYFAAKDWARALQEYSQSASWFEKGGYFIDEMDIWVETAYVFTLEKAPADWEAPVEENLRKLLALSEKISYPIGRYYGLGFSGTLQARHGQLAQAEKLLRQSLDCLREWSQESTESPQARAQTLERPEVRLFADTLVDVLIQQGHPQEAMEVGRQLAAQATSAVLDWSRIVPQKAETARVFQELEQKRQQGGVLRAQLQAAQMQQDQTTVRQLEGQLAKNKAEFHQTVNRLRQQDPEFERLLAIRPSSFSKLQSQLPPEVVLVEYYSGRDRLLLFAVTRDKMEIFSVPLSQQALSEKIRSLRLSFSRGRSLDGTLEELHEALVAPLQGLLAHHSVLAVVPSGDLYYLPFGALRPKDGPFLVESKAVCVVTATELPELSSQATTKKPASLLALADPDGSLPGATREVSQLASLFPRQTSFVGAQATKNRVTGQGDVLHIATHGNLNSVDVNESYLLMAGQDGRLTTGEIYGLDLKKVNLVTLSACETALGETNPGAEVATLAQAFSVAGSRSVVASLWKVEDNSTAALMVAFYKELLAGKGKAEALRLAQLAVMKEPRWSHPFYWSAFELLGDWR